MIHYIEEANANTPLRPWHNEAYLGSILNYRIYTFVQVFLSLFDIRLDTRKNFVGKNLFRSAQR